MYHIQLKEYIHYSSSFCSLVLHPTSSVEAKANFAASAKHFTAARKQIQTFARRTPFCRQKFFEEIFEISCIWVKVRTWKWSQEIFSTRNIETDGAIWATFICCFHFCPFRTKSTKKLWGKFSCDAFRNVFRFFCCFLAAVCATS